MTVMEAFRGLFVDLTALIFNIVLLFIVRAQRGKEYKTVQFRNLTVIVFFANAMSQTWVFLARADLPVRPVLILFAQLTAYMLNLFVVYFFTLYVEKLAQMETGYRKKLHRINYAIMIFMGICVVVYFILTVPELGTPGRLPYATGWFRMFAGFAAEFYFLIYAMTMLIGRTGMNARTKRILPGVFALTFSTLILQAVIGLMPRLDYLGPTLALFIFYFTVETSDYLNLMRTRQELEEETRRTALLQAFSEKVATQGRALLGLNELILRDSHEEKVLMYARNVERTGKELVAMASNMPALQRKAEGSADEAVRVVREEASPADTGIKAEEKAEKKPLAARISDIGRYGSTKDEYESCRERILIWNEKSSRIILSLSFYGFVLAFLATIVMNVMKEFRPAFVLFFCVTGVCYFPSLFARRFFHKHATLMAYTGMVIILSFAIMTGSMHATERAIDYPIMLIWLSLLIVDNAFRMTGLIVVMDAACFTMLFLTKDLSVAQRDMYNILMYSALVIVGHFLLQRNRMNEMMAAGRYEAVQTQLLSTTERLQEATEQATRASHSKSDFLANMSHEIRTPINAVLGMNEMILRESRDEKIRLYAHNVESAGKNLLSIINDILDFSKIEAGRMELAKGEYHLSAVLNDVSNMIIFRARAKDLAFHVNVDECLPDVLYGDEVRIRQVITNILNNAVKYTNEGSVTLTVRGERKAVDAVMQKESDRIHGQLDLIVAVADTGIGIREEDKEKLFTKFERFDLTQTNTIEGTGLGLAITQSLLALMNGTVYVDSVYGEGSTFTLRIPQGIVSEEAIGDFREKTEQNVQASEEYTETFRAPDARILVVDDTEMNLVVMKGLLKQTELGIDTATGGRQALQMTQDTPYDLILMDQRMPEMDGTQTLQGIRAQEGGSNQNTPVICLTADAVQGARDRYLAEGFTDYLTKPVEILSLEAALMKYLPQEMVERVKKRGTKTSQSPQVQAVAGSKAPVSADSGTTAYADSGKEWAQEEALRFMREDTPKLLASLRELETSLRPFLQKADEPDEDLPELSQEELNELYEAIPEFIDVYDQDGILRLLQQTDGYRIPEADRKKLEQVRKCAVGSDWNGLKEAMNG